MVGTIFAAETSNAFGKDGLGLTDSNMSFPDIGTLIGNIIIASMVIAGLMVFFYLIMGGIQYISSGGDKAQAEAARNRITYALIGLVIVVGSFAIIKLVEQFFGLNILKPTLPSATNKLDPIG